MIKPKTIGRELEDPNLFLWRTAGRYGARLRAWRKRRDGTDEQVEVTLVNLNQNDLECIADSIATVLAEDAQNLLNRRSRIASRFA